MKTTIGKIISDHFDRMDKAGKRFSRYMKKKQKRSGKPLPRGTVLVEKIHYEDPQ